MLATGGTDSDLNLWHDCTLEDKEEDFLKKASAVFYYTFSIVLCLQDHCLCLISWANDSEYIIFPKCDNTENIIFSPCKWLSPLNTSSEWFSIGMLAYIVCCMCIFLCVDGITTCCTCFLL
jgi:hypothetical protein